MPPLVTPTPRAIPLTPLLTPLLLLLAALREWDKEWVWHKGKGNTSPINPNHTHNTSIAAAIAIAIVTTDIDLFRMMAVTTTHTEEQGRGYPCPPSASPHTFSSTHSMDRDRDRDNRPFLLLLCPVSHSLGQVSGCRSHSLLPFLLLFFSFHILVLITCSYAQHFQLSLSFILGFEGVGREGGQGQGMGPTVAGEGLPAYVYKPIQFGQAAKK